MRADILAEAAGRAGGRADKGAREPPPQRQGPFGKTDGPAANPPKGGGGGDGPGAASRHRSCDAPGMPYRTCEPPSEPERVRVHLVVAGGDDAQCAGHAPRARCSARPYGPVRFFVRLLATHAPLLVA